MFIVLIHFLSLQALAIYDQAKRLSTVCGVQTYTEALDTCAKSNNVMRMTMIMEDMKVAGCSPNAVTCSVVLVTLGSKCSNSNEVSQLLQCLESFESELMQCCCSLLTDPTRRDEEVHIPHFPQGLSIKIGIC